jgi:hypothetical protein
MAFEGGWQMNDVAKDNLIVAVCNCDAMHLEFVIRLLRKPHSSKESCVAFVVYNEAICFILVTLIRLSMV